MSLLAALKTTRWESKPQHSAPFSSRRRASLHKTPSKAEQSLRQAVTSQMKLQSTIETLIDSFIKTLETTIMSASNIPINYYHILAYMQKKDFFREIAAFFNQHVAARLQEAQNSLQKVNAQLASLRNQIDSFDLQPINSQKFRNRLAGDQTLASNLYYKAKHCSLQEFTQLCEKGFLQQKITISKIENRPAYQQWAVEQEFRQSETDISIKIQEYISAKQSSHLSENEQELLHQLKAFQSRQSATLHQFQCNRPCCQPQTDTLLLRSSSALDSAAPKQSKSFYKTNKAEEYFNRYYRKDQFRLEDVKRLSHTKLEQMEKLEDAHRRSLKLRHKQNLMKQ